MSSVHLTKDVFMRLKESVQFFSNFNDGELLALLKSASREAFKDGDIIFKEGTRGDKMYVILSGKVRISRPLGKKEEEILATLTAGACFGEMGVIDQSPRSARATVEGETALILVIKEYLLKESNLMLAYKLYKNFSVMLAARLREANNKIQDLSSEDKSASSQLKDLVKKKSEQGQNLHGVNLRGADLAGIYLHNANLESAIMIDANMSHAKCKQANFKGARLLNANFSQTDFTGVNLQGADFTGAKFDEVTFSQCNMSGVVFDGVDLTKTQMEELKIGKPKPKNQ